MTSAARPRHLQNTYSAEGGLDRVELAKTLQYGLQRGLEVVRADAFLALQGTVSAASTAAGISGGTTYVGLNGLAYMYWHLSRHAARGSVRVPLRLLPIPADSASSGKEEEAASAQLLAEVALALCNKALEATAWHKARRVTFLEGHAGPLSLKCAVLADLGQMQDAHACVAELAEYATQASAHLPPGECEVLYGRAGLLYALLFAERTVPGAAIPAQLVQQLIRDIVAEGRRCGQAKCANSATGAEPAFMHEWHGKAYLGAAHGSCGILHVRALTLIVAICDMPKDLLLRL